MVTDTPTLPRYRSSDFATVVSLHDRRRRDATPIVTTVVGPIGLGCRLWRDWSATGNQAGIERAVVVVSRETDDVWLARWIDALVRSVDLCRFAESQLAAQTGQNEDALRSRLARMTVRDLMTLLRRFDLVAGDGEPHSVAGHILVGRQLGIPLARHLLSLVKSRSKGSESGDNPDHHGPRNAAESFKLVGELIRLVAPDRSPTLLVVDGPVMSGGCDDSGECESLWHRVAEWAIGVPGLALGMLATPGRWGQRMATLPESFSKAVIRENAFEIEGWSADRLLSRIRVAAGNGPDPSGPTSPAVDNEPTWQSSIEVIRSIGASDRLAEALSLAVASASLEKEGRVEEGLGKEAEEALANEASGGGADDPVAPLWKSAQERFLFEVLDHHHQTGGLFHLNADPGFDFGRGAAEVDLLCPTLRIAIEVDGYFHFLNAQSYRRDRRKDLLLQHHGYLVLRFLAEDVVPELETVLKTVLTAVGARRSRAVGEPLGAMS